MLAEIQYFVKVIGQDFLGSAGLHLFAETLIRQQRLQF